MAQFPKTSLQVTDEEFGILGRCLCADSCVHGLEEVSAVENKIAVGVNEVNALCSMLWLQI